MNNRQRISMKAFLTLQFAFLTIRRAALSSGVTGKSIYRRKKIRKLLKLLQFLGSKI